METIKVATLGEPEAPPVNDAVLGEILFGLCIPNQGTAKSMAR